MPDRKLTQLGRAPSPVRGDITYLVTTESGSIIPTSRRTRIEDLLVGEAKLVAANDSSDEAKKHADYVCDGTLDHVEINAALAELTSGGIVVLSIGTFNLTVMLTMLDDQQLIGSGWGTVLNVTTSTVDVLTMGDRCKLSNLKILGDIAPLTNDFKATVSGDDCIIESIWIDQNDYGIETANKSNVHIKNCKFTNIKATSGWAAAIHGSGTADGIYVDGVFMEDCHRGIEFEDGAKNLIARNGYLKTVRNSIVGGGTIVLDAHTHVGQGTVENVLYDGFYLEDCDGCYAQGVGGADIVKNITYKNITIIDPVLAASISALTVTQAEKVTFDNIRIEQNDGDALAVTNSESVIFRDIRVENVLTSIVLLDNSTSVAIRECSFINTGAAAGVQLRRNLGDAYSILFEKCYVFANASPAVRVFTNLHDVTISNCLIDANGTAYGIEIQTGSEDVKVFNNKVINASTYSVRCFQTRGQVAFNYVDRRMRIEVAASHVWVHDNYLDDRGISDAGSTSPRFYNNFILNANNAFESGQGPNVGYSINNVTNPPTAAEISAAFGTPSLGGRGFMGLIDDNGAGTNMWLCVSDGISGTSWWYQALTKAV